MSERISLPRTIFSLSAAATVAVLCSLAWSTNAYASSRPVIEGESVQSRTPTDVTLGLQIDPNGLETSYQVVLESGCVVEHLACDAISVQNLSIGEIPASSEIQLISIDLNKSGARLHLGSKYAFSVEATNLAGTARGPGGTFTLPESGEPPLIEGESLSRLSPTDATLEAQINTGGLETTYRFKLWASPCSHRGSGCELIEEIKLPSGILLGSNADQRVSLDLSSAGVTLAPGGEYGYAVSATNGDGSTESPWHQFEPPGTPEPPAIDGESVSKVSENDATLEAEIDPKGAYTAYQFEIDTTGNYLLPKRACPLPLPDHPVCDPLGGDETLPAGLLEPSPEYIQAGSGDHSVGLDLASIGTVLRAGTTYHYRVVAQSNGNPLVIGPDQTFKTRSPGPAPLANQVGAAQNSGADGLPPVDRSSRFAPRVHHVMRHRRHRRHQR